MVEIEVKDSARFLRRHMNKALRRSYLKALTEPITNSDDSYTRLKRASYDQGKSKEPSKILVCASQRRKEFDVIDFAEGISHEDMIASFREYGEEKRTHALGGRGVFGQGLSDVMFSRDEGGWVHSIKDESYTSGQFKWKKKKEEGILRERRVIRVTDPCHVDKKIRQQLGIQKNNGTRVSFRFTEARFPTEEELLQSLSQFYMLRLINYNPEREVLVQYVDESGQNQPRAIRYDFPQGVLLGTLSTSMKYDDVDISIDGELYRSDEPLLQGEAGEHRQGGLLVYDEEQSVLDLTLFGSEDDPLAVRLWGKLRLNGAHVLIRRRLKEQDEILSENRDGFTRYHGFYTKLKQIIDNWLKTYIDAERARTTQQQSALTDQTRQEQKKAFEMLNELNKRVNAEVIPLPGTGQTGLQERPKNGIEFSCETATLKRGVRYSVQLRIDAQKIPPSSRIRLKSGNRAVKLKPKSLVVAHAIALPEDEIDRHRILLWSDTPEVSTYILAKAEGRQAKLTVSVVEANIPPPSPEIPELHESLEFHPRSVRRKPGAGGTLHLYVDTDRVPKTGSIRLSSTNEQIKLQVAEVSAATGKQLSQKVAKIDIDFIGNSEGQTGTVTAVYEDCQAQVEIKITSVEGFGDLFHDWDYRDVAVTIQAYFEKETGLVVLNSRHPANKQYFGTDKLEAHISVETLSQSQMLLATLILDVCLWYLYDQAYRNNKIEIRDPKNPHMDIQRNIEEGKFVLGKDFLSKFIKPSASTSVAETPNSGEPPCLTRTQANQEPPIP